MYTFLGLMNSAAKPQFTPKPYTQSPGPQVQTTVDDINPALPIIRNIP